MLLVVREVRVVGDEDVLSGSVCPACLTAGLTNRSLRCGAETVRPDLTVLNTEGFVFV